jgi:hypothetical protein
LEEVKLRLRRSWRKMLVLTGSVTTSSRGGEARIVRVRQRDRAEDGLSRR